MWVVLKRVFGIEETWWERNGEFDDEDSANAECDRLSELYHQDIFTVEFEE